VRSKEGEINKTTTSSWLEKTVTSAGIFCIKRMLIKQHLYCCSTMLSMNWLICQDVLLGWTHSQLCNLLTQAVMVRCGRASATRYRVLFGHLPNFCLKF